jgi:hypothetical protein
MSAFTLFSTGVGGGAVAQFSAENSGCWPGGDIFHHVDIGGVQQYNHANFEPQNGATTWLKKPPNGASQQSWLLML